MSANPEGAKRLGELDVLRGFAMLGVYIVNFEEMNALPPGEVGIYPERFPALDAFLAQFYQLFLKEKFYLLFVFLFGFSLSIAASSAEKQHLPVDWVVIRRMAALLVIGLILSGLFCWGVILVPEAIFGLIMWTLVRLFPQKVSLALAAALILLVTPLANHLQFVGTYSYALDTAPLTALFAQGGLQNWLRLIPVQLHGIHWGFFADGDDTQFYPRQIADLSSLLGLFILGWYAAMHKVITRAANRTYFIVIEVALVFFVLTRYVDPSDYFHFHWIALSTVMGSVVILLFRTWETPVCHLFSLVGRTSFSAYAFHLMVGAVIFFLLGNFQKFSLSTLFALAIGTYLLGAWVCWLMQQRFGYGVFEMLMKYLTYGPSVREASGAGAWR